MKWSGVKVNLLEALEARGIEYKPHSSRENEIYLCCPFCTDRGETPDTRFRFGINYVTGQAHCFNCEKRFRNPQVLQQALQEKLATGEWELAQQARRRKMAEAPAVKLPEDFELIKSGGGGDHWGQLAWEYIHSRGVANWQTKEKGIGYSMVGDLRYRIIIPVYYQGKLEGLIGRAFVHGLEPKYKNSLGNKTLFNVPKNPAKRAVLVEGAFDALAVERARILGMDSLAVLGHSLTERQLGIIKEHYEEVVLWTDPDVAGLQGLVTMGRQCSDLHKKVEVHVPDLEAAKRGEEHEPSECTALEIKSVLHRLMPYTVDLGLHLKAQIAFAGGE